jgi:hypothetical protein
MNKMNIRKQLDELKKNDMRELNRAADVIYKIIRPLVRDGKLNTDFHLEFERLLDAIESVMTPDPKGDISDIEREKLDEWSRRNQKIDTEELEEEKVWGAVAGALAGDDE